MTEPYLVWALLVGVALGGVLVWFALGRLPRRSEDVGAEERLAEAAWISDVVASRGGAVPPLLVEQVLELHSEYLAGPPIEITPDERDRLRAAREAMQAELAEWPDEPGSDEPAEPEPAAPDEPDEPDEPAQPADETATQASETPR